MTDKSQVPNPKDEFGSAKVPVGLYPDTATQEMAFAFLEGALKYGRYNWRVVGVRASIYNDAMERHRMKWWNGQNRDPVTRVRELASVMACCAILIDSEICGVLNDDRPPMAPMGELLDINMEMVAHLKELFKDHHPVQYTIADTPGLGECQDEGCPHYGTPHGHTSATNEATVEPQPEGFPGGFEVKPGDTFRADGPEHDPYDHPDAFEQYRESMVMPAVQAAEVTRAALTLDCGCVKRCKGHTTENFRAAPVDIVPAFKATLTGTVMSPTSSPGNYAAERASGPKDPQGRPYATTTADAEFPLAPPVTRPRTFEDFSASIAGLPLVGVETDGPMEFDPAD